MARLPSRALKIVRAYVAALRKEIPIRRALLYGSYARGVAHDTSDIDIAIFSDAFQGRRRVDVIAYLVQKAAPFPLPIEPIGFPYKDYIRPGDDNFLRAIRREGQIIR